MTAIETIAERLKLAHEKAVLAAQRGDHAAVEMHLAAAREALNELAGPAEEGSRERAQWLLAAAGIAVGEGNYLGALRLAGDAAQAIGRLFAAALSKPKTGA